MKKVLILLVLVCSLVSVEAYAEKISFEENMIWGNTYFVDGKKIESWFVREELRKIMQDNPESVKILDGSIAYGMSSTLLLVSGVLMVGEQLVKAAEDNDPSATITVAGIGFVRLGMWLREKTQLKYKKAIDLFNVGVGAGSSAVGGVTSGAGSEPQPEPQNVFKKRHNEFHFVVSPQSIGLSLQFY